MVDEVRADPVELAKLAGKTLDAAGELGDAWRNAQPGLAIPAAAFGNLSASGAAYSSHRQASEDGDTATGRLIAVYEGDVDRLYRVAFAYQQADQDAASRLTPGTSGPPR